VERFLSWLRDQTVVPIIVSLRARLETIRQQEVAKALSRLGETTPEARQAIETMSAAIVNKILHLPIVKLREASRLGNGQLGPLVQELFGLSGDLADKDVKHEE
jgi:glutamyl-tRNA reductase